MLKIFRNFTPETNKPSGTDMLKKTLNALNNRQLPPPIRGCNILRNNHLQGTPRALLHLALSICGRVFLTFSRACFCSAKPKQVSYCSRLSAALCLLLFATLFSCKNDDVHFVEISEYYAESCHLDVATQDSIESFARKVEDFVTRNPLAKEDPLYPRILHNIKFSSFEPIINFEDGWAGIIDISDK